jgi:hypothetical protein
MNLVWSGYIARLCQILSGTPYCQCAVKSSFRVRCGSVRVRCGSEGRGSDSSASACCTAGPSSNLGSAPLEEALHRADAIRITRVVLYEYYI